MRSRSKSRTQELSIEIVARDVSLSSIMVDRWKVLISFSLLKLLSAPATETGQVNKTRVVNLGPVYTIPGSGFPGILDL